MALVLNNIFRFIVLILFQGLVLNQVALAGGYIQPLLYVMALILLPFELPLWIVMFIALATGFSIDVFSSTLGMHMSACLMLAFFRNYMLKLLSPREGYEFGLQPRIEDMGLAWFLSYAGVLVLIHHLWLFFIEIFRFAQFWQTLGRTLLSTLFTLLLIVLMQYLFYDKKR
jgi:hypothetical protein